MRTVGSRRKMSAIGSSAEAGARHHQHATIRSVIIDKEMMSSNGTDFGKAVSILSRQFIKSAAAIKQVALRCHFTTYTQGTLLHQLTVAAVAQRQSPAAVGIIGDKIRALVCCHHLSGYCHPAANEVRRGRSEEHTSE